MKLVVIGSGGREHAVVWKLAQSPRVTELWCAPGNAGIAEEKLAGNQSPVQCVEIRAEDLPKLLAFAQEKEPDLTVVGPDNPLALGIVDLFQQNGRRIWGPNQKAAQFEASKAFSQNFMEKYGISTAKADSFDDLETARAFVWKLNGECAIKADGLALGKGVLLTETIADAEVALHQLMVERKFGDAGKRIVVQELLHGTEISLHALCDGRRFKLFPTSQDHKRSHDEDEGSNTGGMGAYSPAPFLNDQQLAQVGRQILDPWLRGCEAEG